MAVSNMYSSSGSATSLLPGNMQFLVEYSRHYKELLTSALNQALRDYEKEVRAKARATWGDLADTISISFDPATGDITFEAAPEAAALEYGTPDQAPSAVLRMASVDATHGLPMRVDAIMSKGM